MRALTFAILMAISSVGFAAHGGHGGHRGDDYRNRGDFDHHGGYDHHGNYGRGSYGGRYYGEHGGFYFGSGGVSVGIGVGPNYEYAEEPYYIYDQYGNRVLVHPHR